METTRMGSMRIMEKRKETTIMDLESRFLGSRFKVWGFVSHNTAVRHFLSIKNVLPRISRSGPIYRRAILCPLAVVLETEHSWTS